MSSGVMPPASISSTWLTVIRMPRIVGSPPHTSGLIVIRSICMKLFYKNLRITQSHFSSHSPVLDRWAVKDHINDRSTFQLLRTFRRFVNSKNVQVSEFVLARPNFKQSALSPTTLNGRRREAGFSFRQYFPEILKVHFDLPAFIVFEFRRLEITRQVLSCNPRDRARALTKALLLYTGPGHLNGSVQQGYARLG